jgi:hypothetical protein
MIIAFLAGWYDRLELRLEYAERRDMSLNRERRTVTVHVKSDFWSVE